MTVRGESDSDNRFSLFGFGIGSVRSHNFDRHYCCGLRLFDTGIVYRVFGDEPNLKGGISCEMFRPQRRGATMRITAVMCVGVAHLNLNRAGG